MYVYFKLLVYFLSFKLFKRITAASWVTRFVHFLMHGLRVNSFVTLMLHVVESTFEQLSDLLV